MSTEQGKTVALIDGSFWRGFLFGAAVALVVPLLFAHAMPDHSTQIGQAVALLIMFAPGSVLLPLMFVGALAGGFIFRAVSAIRQRSSNG